MTPFALKLHEEWSQYSSNFLSPFPIYETFQTELFINPWCFLSGFQWIPVKRIRSLKRKCVVATRGGSKVETAAMKWSVSAMRPPMKQRNNIPSGLVNKSWKSRSNKDFVSVFKPSFLPDVKNARWNQGKQKNNALLLCLESSNWCPQFLKTL